MSPHPKSERPLPYLMKEKGVEDECRALGLDRRRRKFSLRDLLARIAQHNAGDNIILREDDEPLRQPLCEAGLLKLVATDGALIPERTDLRLDETQINTLRDHLEKEIAKFRDTLKKTGT